MAKYIKTKDGKFAGSIGAGKTSPPTVGAAPAVVKVPAHQPADDLHTVFQMPFTDDLRHVPATEMSRAMYAGLRGRIAQVGSADADELDTLAADNPKFQVLTQFAAGQSLAAAEAGRTNEARLWGSVMDFTRFCHTDSRLDANRTENLHATCVDLVEYIQREEVIEDYASRGYDRELSETLEDMWRRSGGRDRPYPFRD